MDKWIGKIVLLTGVTDGTGNFLCKQLVDFGMTVVGVARSTEKLKVINFYIKFLLMYFFSHIFITGNSISKKRRFFSLLFVINLFINLFN